MCISSWFRISYTKYFLNILFAHVNDYNFCLRPSILPCLYCHCPPCCPYSSLSLLRCIRVRLRLRISSRACVHIQNSFPLQSTRKYQGLCTCWRLLQITKPVAIMQFKFTPPGYKTFEFLIWVLFLPTVIEAECFPHMNNTKYHFWFSPLPIYERFKILLHFLMCISLLINEGKHFFHT